MSMELIAGVNDGLGLIAAERRRHLTVEGWTQAHDDAHTEDELANAAACYAMSEDHRGDSPDETLWPWDASWWKPTPDNRVRELVKAGALIAAEIDRLLRASEPTTAAHVNRPGYDALWLWFGLSRASFLTMPRVMMHDMPDDWQARMAQLCFEWNAVWLNQPDLETCVCLRQDGKFVSYPEWMLNYRHPDGEQLSHMKSVGADGYHCTICRHPSSDKVCPACTGVCR